MVLAAHLEFVTTKFDCMKPNLTGSVFLYCSISKHHTNMKIYLSFPG